jgi:hypothetical protein
MGSPLRSRGDLKSFGFLINKAKAEPAYGARVRWFGTSIAFGRWQAFGSDKARLAGRRARLFLYTSSGVRQVHGCWSVNSAPVTALKDEAVIVVV